MDDLHVLTMAQDDEGLEIGPVVYVRKTAFNEIENDLEVVDFTVTDADGNVTTENLAYGGVNADGDPITVTKAFADPACQALGAFRTAQQACGFQYTYFDNWNYNKSKKNH